MFIETYSLPAFCALVYVDADQVNVTTDFNIGRYDQSILNNKKSTRRKKRKIEKSLQIYWKKLRKKDNKDKEMGEKLAWEEGRMYLYTSGLGGRGIIGSEPGIWLPLWVFLSQAAILVAGSKNTP
jgi:hypothetical protein